jgi:hypothetical protein
LLLSVPSTDLALFFFSSCKHMLSEAVPHAMLLGEKLSSARFCLISHRKKSFVFQLFSARASLGSCDLDIL